MNGAVSQSARRKSLSFAVSAVFFGLSSVSVNAQDVDENVEEIVVTASGFSQRLIDAPASISLVSAEELKQRPYMTLIDAVRELEGVDVGETSDKTGQRTISMRGMGGDYTLLLIDGKRQNNHGDIYPNNFGGNQFNHIPPLDTIERIEVIRGPASTLYGADALGGVINVITKRNIERWSGSFTAGHSFQDNDMFGTDTTYDMVVNGPLIPNVLNASLRASRYERDASQPEYELVTDPAGVSHERALGFGSGGKTVDNVNQSLGFTLGWNISEKQRLTVDYDNSQQDYDNTPFTNNLGTLSYPLGTVDNIESIWAERRGSLSPRAGYAADQEFIREQYAFTHEADLGFAQSYLSLANIETSNEGRTLPLTVAERQLLAEMYYATGDYRG